MATLLTGTTLVLGGARSGKSVHAEKLVIGSGKSPVYLATGRALDDEMLERIEKHRDRRGDKWETVEEPLALVDALRQASHKDRIILVDCLTLWITNLMMAEANVVRECAGLVDYIKQSSVPIVFVSNETGMGLVPETKMGRKFRDLQGRVNQEVAAACDQVFFVAAGLPLQLK